MTSAILTPLTLVSVGWRFIDRRRANTPPYSLYRFSCKVKHEWDAVLPPDRRDDCLRRHRGEHHDRHEHRHQKVAEGHEDHDRQAGA